MTLLGTGIGRLPGRGDVYTGWRSGKPSSSGEEWCRPRPRGGRAAGSMALVLQKVTTVSGGHLPPLQSLLHGSTKMGALTP